MAESENNAEETLEQGRRDGLAVGLSGKPICQIKAPKSWAADKAPSRLGNLPFSSNYTEKLDSQQRKINEQRS